jgi:predicted alpha/beta superfamily hydrolase
MIIKRDVLFTPAGSNRCLHIYLPDSYAEGNDLYPVMYFFDGHNLFDNADATYGKSWGLKEFLEGWGKEIIIVGLECSHEGNQRLQEYCPYTFRGKFWGGTLKGTGKETLQWMVSELKPMIDREYRTIPFRECTAIGGSSMGGIMALYAGVHYNRWFSKAACVSTAMGFCMEPLKWDLSNSAISPDTRIYLSWGTREAKKDHYDRSDRSSPTYHNHKYVSDVLRKRKATVKLHCQVNGGHCEADWEKLVPSFMHFLWLE